jgi:hypothetical protein
MLAWHLPMMRPLPPDGLEKVIVELITRHGGVSDQGYLDDPFTKFVPDKSI